ncbi:hypothetical protein DMENIID0001_165060 [Sergentomyia squamirostris]
MEKFFVIRLNLLSLDFFAIQALRPDYTVLVHINFFEKSTILKIPASELENFSKNHDFSIKLLSEDVKKILSNHRVVLKFNIRTPKYECFLGESELEWNQELLQEISQDDFTVCNFTHVLQILGNFEHIMGQFQLMITLTTGSSDEKNDTIEKGDVFFAICHDNNEPTFEEQRGETITEHKCVGGLINLSGCEISNGDRVNLHRITLPNGQLGCPVEDVESFHSSIQSERLQTTLENGFVQSFMAVDAENDWDNEVIAATKSQSYAYCTRLCSKAFGRKQLANDTTTTCTICPSGQHSDEAVARAIALIKGWGKVGRSRVKRRIMFTKNEKDMN